MPPARADAAPQRSRAQVFGTVQLAQEGCKADSGHRKLAGSENVGIACVYSTKS